MPKMRVADYVAQRAVEFGIRDVFLVTGGGAMHLNDAFGRNKALKTVAFHHEQACAMAAEGYYRESGKIALVNVTTGPGGTNAITGVWGAYVDSMAMLVVSGQVKRETTVRYTNTKLRQLGDQEVDITTLVQSITKYAASVESPERIAYHLDRALYEAVNGRPGPTWVDVPMDVQGAQIDTDTLERWTPPAPPAPADVERQAQQIREKILAAKRPVIMVGSGVRIAGVRDDVLKWVESWNLPLATAFNAHDVVWNDHPNYVGRPGTVGDRPGNFAVQNSDLVVVLGCRLNIRQISYNYQSFARASYKIVVDIDAEELKKPTLKIDMPVQADLKPLMAAFLRQPKPAPNAAHEEFRSWCRERVAKYPVALPEYEKKPAPINPYTFADHLYRHLSDDDCVVTGDGTACVVTFQAAHIKKNQRLFSNSGSAPMGFDVPGSIGACIARKGKRVICMAGDGSLQMNLQELATIAAHKLPVKIFVVNNDGYLSIRLSQEAFFSDNVFACTKDNGLFFPDLSLLTRAYGIPYFKSSSLKDIDEVVVKTLETPGPVMCEVMVDPKQAFSPKASSKRLADGRMVTAPLEDLAPFLSREELKQNMLIPVLDQE